MEEGLGRKEHTSFSFRDMLVGQPGFAGVIYSGEWISEDDQESEDDPFCPTRRVSKEEKVRIRRPWQKTLIIKLLSDTKPLCRK